MKTGSVIGILFTQIGNSSKTPKALWFIIFIDVGFIDAYQ